jgi:hypothetical protein
MCFFELIIPARLRCRTHQGNPFSQGSLNIVPAAGIQRELKTARIALQLDEPFYLTKSNQIVKVLTCSPEMYPF